MNKILDVVEDIKQNITDKQYKTIMDSLMEINNNNKDKLTNNHQLNKISYLFIWLNSKLRIVHNESASIKRTDLHKYIITNYFDNDYYENINIVKQMLKIYFTVATSEQEDKIAYCYVNYREDDLTG